MRILTLLLNSLCDKVLRDRGIPPAPLQPVTVNADDYRQWPQYERVPLTLEPVIKRGPITDDPGRRLTVREQAIQNAERVIVTTKSNGPSRVHRL